MKTKSLVLIALFAALTAVFAQISIPLPFTPVPLSLATLAGLLAAGMLSWKAAALSQVVYVLLGVVGVPVFAGFTSTAKLAGPTGGYIIGYIFAALIAGLIIHKTKGNALWMVIAMIAGTFACYLFGTIWFMLLTKTGLLASLAACVFPFLLGDAIKIVCAVLLSKAVRPRLAKLGVAVA